MSLYSSSFLFLISALPDDVWCYHSCTSHSLNASLYGRWPGGRRIPHQYHLLRVWHRYPPAILLWKQVSVTLITLWRTLHWDHSSCSPDPIPREPADLYAHVPSSISTDGYYFYYSSHRDFILSLYPDFWCYCWCTVPLILPKRNFMKLNFACSCME